MRIAVIGLPSSGKTTVFRALTGSEEAAVVNGAAVRSVPVPDDRVTRLAEIYEPRKTTYAAVEYVDLGTEAALRRDGGELGARFLTAVRPAAVLVHVVDAFSLPEDADAAAAEAIEAVDTEFALADIAVCDKRLTRLRKEGAKNGPAAAEAQLLEQALAHMGDGQPLRTNPELAQHETLRAFALLSAKPVITVVNVAEEGLDWQPNSLPDAIRAAREGDWGRIVPLCGKVEAELAELAVEEAADFLADYGISAPARERVIRLSYDLLGLMSFFTVGEDEVRAWTVRRGAPAQEAAGAIHSDIARGFIRAEVVDYDTALAQGGFEGAKRAGSMRLEGKEYVMKDGDIASFRFNV